MSKKKPPNILILMTDQHRFDVSGFMGNQIVRTPNLDRLAENGVIFENCYTPSPVCIPARQAMMAGQLPKTCGCERFGEDLPPFYDTFARRLNVEAGYETVCSGKLHHTGKDQMQGWTHRIAGDMHHGIRSKYAPDKGQMRWSTTKEIRRAGVGKHRHIIDDEFAVLGAKNFIKEYFCSPYYDKQRGEVPLLLKVSLTQPHYPYQTEEERFCYYLNRVKPYLKEGLSGHKVLDKKRIDIGFDVSEREVLRATAAYYGMIEYADTLFGQVISSLEQAGQDMDDWVIIFTSDHGDMLGEHGVWMKHCFYEGSVHVPLLLRYPKGFGKRRIGENVNLYDLYATLCEFAGIDPPKGLDSRSLIPLIEGKKWDNISISQYGGEFLMIKQDHLKYQYYQKQADEVLFDLQKDKDEIINFAKEQDYQGQMEQFRAMARTVMEDINV